MPALRNTELGVKSQNLEKGATPVGETLNQSVGKSGVWGKKKQ